MVNADIIAIDGPAASGKSTVAELLARRLGYLYLDTGVMYRAVTLAMLQKQIPVNDEAAVTNLAREIKIDVRPPSVEDQRMCDVLLDGVDVTWEIRKREVEQNVSQVSAYRGVRDAMTQQQREIGRRGKVIMVGRDIGTVVFPEAGLKIFLDASVEERAKRRAKELQERGKTIGYQEVLEDMKARDRIDSTREIAPLKPAKDAVVISSDGLTVDQVLQKILNLLNK